MQILRPSDLSLLKLFKKDSFEDFHFETDSNGFYSLPLEPEMHIFIKAQKIEYFADANVQSTIGLSESQEFVIDFYLIIIKKKSQFCLVISTCGLITERNRI